MKKKWKKWKQKEYWKNKWAVTWKNTLVTAAILIAVTLVAYWYHRISAGTVNIVMFYTIALIFIPRFTDGFVPGIVAAMVSVMCVNVLFTEPYYEMNFTQAGYPVTFFCMLVIAIAVSAATSYTKMQSRILAQQEKQLMEAEKEKMRANLLLAVSQDLRTPLTGIIGASSSYLENEAVLEPAKKREMVVHIREDANWLLNMVENLLTVTRIRNDSASVSKSMEPVEEVLEEALQRLKKRLPEAKIKVTLPDEFVMIPMDALLIEQVLINLMENAVFHGGSQRPAECFAKIEEKQVVFYVRDYGVGFPEDRLSTIFEGESQTEHGATDSHRGMGIGLTICKTIVAAHGGTIQAQNLPDGAQIYFSLPRE